MNSKYLTLTLSIATKKAYAKTLNPSFKTDGTIYVPSAWAKNAFETRILPLVFCFFIIKLSLESCRRYHIQNTKLLKQHHNKQKVNVLKDILQTKNRGRMEVPPWNGQKHISLWGLNQV